VSETPIEYTTLGGSRKPLRPSQVAAERPPLEDVRARARPSEAPRPGGGRERDARSDRARPLGAVSHDPRVARSRGSGKKSGEPGAVLNNPDLPASKKRPQEFLLTPEGIRRGFRPGKELPAWGVLVTRHPEKTSLDAREVRSDAGAPGPVKQEAMVYEKRRRCEFV
jgi:hypothetical protein